MCRSVARMAGDTKLEGLQTFQQKYAPEKTPAILGV